MRHEQTDVRPQALPAIAIALRLQVSRPAAIGIDENTCDALRQEGLALLERFGRETRASVRMDVDEAWCDSEPTRINHARGAGFAETADGANAIASDADIRENPGVAVAVKDVAVADEQVEALGCLKAGKEQ